MTKRKSVLLCAIGILLCIYIVQLIQANKSTIKNMTLKAEPDTFTITTADSTVIVTKKDGNWFVGDKQYLANTTSAQSIANNITDITVLDVVSSSDNEATLERYGLTNNALTVTAAKDGKTVRTITIGKASSTTSQTYIKVDDSKNIYLVSGSYNNIYNKTVNELRSRDLYSVEADTITAVSVASANGTAWSIAKNQDTWSVTSGSTGADPDNEKLSTFVSSVRTMNVQSWADESETLPTVPSSTITVTTNEKTITVTVYPVEQGEETKYLATSSESPYLFYLSKYYADKAMTSLEQIQ
ncbi:MAG: DUF4340 domain-containing protein [Treponema sp.]|nr:DUF4340 domain-containing protein [Treponema sp.]